MARAVKIVDPVTGYARDVVRGKVVAGQLVRQACQRHLDDLKTAKARGYIWRLGHPSAKGKPAPARTAWHALEFFRHLRHYKGKWAGQPLVLEPWQRFIVGSLFGWRRRDGTRRFRTAYCEIARKNGKSTIAGGIGLYMLVADGEAGAEVYSAATKRDQAKIVFDAAAQMVKRSPGLKRLVAVYKANLSVLSTASKFEPLGADEDGMDGLNVHCALVDELHAHKTRGTWDVLETAVGARQQPLMFAITTAGFIRGICYELRTYAVKILDGLLSDVSTDSVFAFVATLDPGDDWRDPTVWVKANPGLGVSVAVDELERQAAKAAELPAAQNNFRCKRLNQWVEQAERWVDMARWDECGDEVDPEALAGRECFGGLDLSATTDLTAFLLVFPPAGEDELWRLLAHFWVPEDRITKVSEGHLVDRVPYDVWQRQGLIEGTDGNVVDYDVLRARVGQLGQRYRIREIGYDPWNATQLAVQLQTDGFQMVEMRQGARTLSAPMKYLEGLILDAKLAHGANDVLRWMAGNVAVKVDDNGNITPSKKLSTGRIDGIVAAVMALGRATVAADATSIYSTQGIMTL